MSAPPRAPARSEARRRPAGRRSRSLATLLGAGALAAAALVTAPLGAAPTVWARALDPEADHRAALIAQADALLARYNRLRRSPLLERVEEIGPLWLREARALYERAGAATSRDHAVRLRYADILESLGDVQSAAANLEALLRIHPPAPARAEAWHALAVCYARLGRYADEIKAYDEALALEPHTGSRALLLANQAEAFMVLGDITSAVDGYRAALATLGSLDMFRYGVTTLWGLAVALDRSGDLEGAIEHIRLARTYDRNDQQIHGSGWFYVPPYDEAWYAALGHWAAARSADLDERAGWYQQAVDAWASYIARAPASDHWVPLARARRAQCEKERAETLRRQRKPPAPAAARRR
ncbi:tetratricopeptide repeat protein [Sorangium sp. So ce1036]|uniref:tetratricopeptide repeat protein n=1 Tax=Sorangium sp. So ce1036 TaxID=3133328 RepID=UPI003F11DCBD